MATKLLTPRNLIVPNGVAQVAIQVIREAPLPYHDQGGFPLCDTPEKVARLIASVAPLCEAWDWDKENFMVLLLSTRRKVIGWQLVSSGTLDTLLVHPRDVYRAAVIANAHAVIAVHNHPSGDPTPSEADIRVTRDLIRAGGLLRIEMVDHVIIGAPAMVSPGARGWASLRELGFFSF